MSARPRHLVALLSLVWPIAGSMSAQAYTGIDQRPINSGPGACVAFDKPVAASAGTLQAVAPTDTGPFYWQPSPTDAAAWYYVNDRRQIRLWREGQSLAQSRLLLDLGARVGILNLGNFTDAGGSEEFGVVSFALHPQFANNAAKRLIYVIWNGRKAGDAATTSTLAEYPIKADGSFDIGGERILLQTRQGTLPWEYLHHFDHVLFGTDGYLYMSMGDGNQKPLARDPKEIYHGKLLRLDVDTRFGSKPYGIPADNPYATDTRFAPEVYAYGFRHPWRFSIDRTTGEIWLGDVGHDRIEEIDKVVKGGNYGWPSREGRDCYETANCNLPGLIDPIYQYPQSEFGNVSAIIGGVVYRGNQPGLEWLRGQYLFGTYPNGTVWRLVQEGGQWTKKALTTVPGGLGVSGFVTDRDNNVYVTSIDAWVPKGFWRLATGQTVSAKASVPALLSQTNCVNMADPTVPRANTIPFNVSMPLWSDNTDKRRFLALPEGARVTITPSLDLDFPVGTVLIKTFLYSATRVPHETRLLMRFADGTWGGFSYAWRGADAELVPPEGRVERVRFNPAGTEIRWSYPGRDACFQCHTTVAGTVLGPEVMQLNTWVWYPQARRTANQLDTWQHIGVFANPLPSTRQNLPSFPWRENRGESSIRLARAYLHANCSYCHQPGGPTTVGMDFRFRQPIEAIRACNVAPSRGDLGIVNPAILKPGDPASSIIPVRMRRRYASLTSPALLHPEQMPPLGTTWVDNTALTAFIDPWIRRGDVCAVQADADQDGVGNNADNCLNDANPAQYDFDGDGFGQLCDADLNNDGVVNQADQTILTASMGASRGELRFNPLADFNADDVVDAADQSRFTTLRSRSARPGPSGVKPAS